MGGALPQVRQTLFDLPALFGEGVQILLRGIVRRPGFGHADGEILQPLAGLVDLLLGALQVATGQLFAGAQRLGPAGQRIETVARLPQAGVGLGQPRFGADSALGMVGRAHFEFRQLLLGLLSQQTRFLQVLL